MLSFPIASIDGLKIRKHAKIQRSFFEMFMGNVKELQIENMTNMLKELLMEKCIIHQH